jgi:peptide/nickel transport system substrate-binding protein/oligopeptide transport system substrate-binding protein
MKARISLLALVAGLAIAGCGGAGKPAASPTGQAPAAANSLEPSGDPVKGGTFTMALASDVPTMDPAQAGFDFASWSMTVAQFSGLVDYDQGTKLRADAAERWEVSKDAKTYTFHLRANLKFSDGSPVTSSAVKFSLQRVVDPATGSPGAYLFADIVGASRFSSGKAKDISGIATPDARTVVIHLSAPTSYFLNILAMPYARIMDPATVKKYGKQISQHPVGSGPFVLKQWESGRRITLDRNPSYYDAALPYLDRVVVDVNVNDQTRVLEFQRGQLSISDIPSAAYQQVTGDPKLKPYISTNRDPSTYFIGMKNLQKPFNDVRVRQALNYAVNKQRVVQLLNGRGVVSHGVIPPPLAGYDKTRKPYAFDPAKAKQMLKEAGYPNGFSTEIWTINDEQGVRIVQSVANDLARVGVKAKVRSMNSSTFYAGVGAKDKAPMYYTFWLQDYPDAYDFFSNLLTKAAWGPTNSAYFSDPTVEGNTAAVAHSTDQAARIKTMRETDAAVFAQAPWIFLHHGVTQNVHQPDVFYNLHPVHLWRFADYWIKKAS